MTGATLRILPAGDCALLLEPSPGSGLDRLIATLAEERPPGVVDVLPGAETVLVTLTDDADASTVSRMLLRAFENRSGRQARPADHGSVVTIPVRYDGADLDDVARLLDVDTTEVVARHTGVVWQCRFIGFTAGFGYLTAADAGLTVPRREQSRTAVPAGAVALAGGYSAVYPRRAPGGWQLIGTTTATMWDLDRPTPSLLAPGTRVRFREAT